MGGLYGLMAWIHDIVMVKTAGGNLQPAGGGRRSPEEIVTHYAPVCFFLIGLTYAASALLAFHIFVIQNKSDPASVVWVSDRLYPHVDNSVSGISRARRHIEDRFRLQTAQQSDNSKALPRMR